MGDYVERTVIGDIYVEISALSEDSTQVRLGHSDAGQLFDTQACDAQGMFHEYMATSEIAIGVDGPERVRDFAASLRWLADAIENHARISKAAQ